MELDTGLDNAGNDIEGWSAAGHEKSGSPGADPHAHAAPDQPDATTPCLNKLAQDWITLWQSELSAMAADPELHAAWSTMMTVWAGTMSAMLRGMPAASRHERRHAPPDARPRSGTAHASRSGTVDAKRPAAAAAAPDPRDAEIDRLARHVAALERRLADLERGGDPPVPPKVRPGRKSRR